MKMKRFTANRPARDTGTPACAGFRSQPSAQPGVAVSLKLILPLAVPPTLPHIVYWQVWARARAFFWRLEFWAPAGRRGLDWAQLGVAVPSSNSAYAPGSWASASRQVALIERLPNEGFDHCLAADVQLLRGAVQFLQHGGSKIHIHPANRFHHPTGIGEEPRNVLAPIGAPGDLLCRVYLSASIRSLHKAAASKWNRIRYNSYTMLRGGKFYLAYKRAGWRRHPLFGVCVSKETFDAGRPYETPHLARFCRGGLRSTPLVTQALQPLQVSVHSQEWLCHLI